MDPLLLSLFAALIFSIPGSPASAQTSPTTAFRFSPADNILINCGAASSPVMPDGRSFKTDAQSSPFLSAADQISASVPSASGVSSPLYLSARVFRAAATYTFQLSRPGWHWIRLHFFPVPFPAFDLSTAVFSVTTDDFVLLHSFNLDDPSKWVLKEFVFNATKDRFSLHFSPMRNSAAFINGIEIVSAPDFVVADTATFLFPVGQASGLAALAYHTAYRLNVGGATITSANDTLGRQWSPDGRYLSSHSTAKVVSVEPKIVQYPDGGSPLIAPRTVYASAVKMADAQVGSPNFNVTWQLDVDAAFGYLVRLHFCDIISKSLNDLYFNVYINGLTAISGLDLSTLSGGQLATAYYKDIVVNATLAADRITVQIGPTREDTGRIDALLNGLEVFKMSNSVGSLDGEFGVDGSEVSDGEVSSSRRAVAAVGYKRPDDWRKRNSFSSWLLPIHTTQSSFTSSKAGSGFGSRSGYTFSSTLGAGRCFSLSELQDATRNWDAAAIIGVGGFGNVYLGELDDGTKVAVKRGNPQSEQGATEFETEIQMLSKLRHRHLVSLIGCCDENSEMILVYEYMANGPFRDHIYGQNLPPLTWKQRLEICIGAARGLHYLHTGTAQGIIHRDVKTTNILLDENFVAKVSDFGLSKDAPGMNQTHVSTAVKGSFGYLDPEYFRRQQLTDKSDVYSFGVVLLETLCARPALDPALPRDQVNLAEWAMQWKRKGQVEKIIDPRLLGTINGDSLNKFVEAAEKCLSECGVDRPSMGDVLWNLEYALQLQEANPPAAAMEAPVSGEERDERNGSSSPAPAATDGSSTAVANELFAQLAGMKGR
ncbi:putative receptor-like protein kinase [Apostasia shenzhenica]|uniref:Putative receptor-like protein kinase n=1 Tax=Apostasia shenzhenica TaxID=1088818 RepID=A0A2I0B822_9ASPA|nr:putative receptor-like protein kinase [Apostasia shenzhenica]